MNKAQLVEALTTRIGDRRTAAAAVDGIVDVIVETVGSGRSVTLTGFGVFEPRRRAARVARNPRTGETVPVPETIVPSFRPGAAFRDQIGSSEEAAAGATSAPRRAPRNGSGRAASANGTGARTTRTRSAGTRSAAAKTTTSKTARSAASGTSATGAAKGGTAAKGAAADKPAAASRSRRSAATPPDGTTAPVKRTRNRASST